jgi:hypothetical protein
MRRSGIAQEPKIIIVWDTINYRREMARKSKTSLGVVLSEDWLALIIGLILTALVWIGVITKIPWPVFGWLK